MRDPLGSSLSRREKDVLFDEELDRKIPGLKATHPSNDPMLASEKEGHSFDVLFMATVSDSEMIVMMVNYS